MDEGQKEFNSKLFVGRDEQINGVHSVTFNRGKATGMRALRVYTQAGLSMLISIDRGMDIPELKIRGNNISFMSATGFVNSTYFTEDYDRGFMRNFNVGFLTTGGLSYMGASTAEDNKGLHGVIDNTPAENYGYEVTEREISIYGSVRESEMFGPNLLLNRRITVNKFKNEISIHDEVVNDGPQSQSLMMLYHTNFGYPFFSPSSVLTMKPLESYYRTGESASDWSKFSMPNPDTKEVVYFHRLGSDGGMSSLSIQSPLTHLQLDMKYSSETLPVLNQWKLQQTRNYVLGIEPATNNVNGYAEAKSSNSLQYLNAGGRRSFDLHFTFSSLEP